MVGGREVVTTDEELVLRERGLERDQVVKIGRLSGIKEPKSRGNSYPRSLFCIRYTERSTVDIRTFRSNGRLRA